ncbi:TPA_asm: hypothetical protein PROPHIFSQJ01-1_20 [Mycobacterium phage prophiFSQJ01-1]|nr:Uncharacterised protein [Mycobacteroides abscessus subsp. abscessus]SIK14827.1 Uncharacterised protein [Mycobacteroides abscessus subsp. abscessus]SIN24989.1 Uncharacterised protein [Mycobacteroides abscessus subsp. abscessus]SLI51934.1 Uncharacterised protein [Mycobacteroides abscessus subsp. abscessus]DAZ90306.1 TPA_asm: hypothetical protein PROPHIFSQJ01-1_20 [Mycobacterium phage prophiFSQJ01-1]
MSDPTKACACGHDEDTHVAGFGQCLGCVRCPDVPHSAKSGHVYGRCICTGFQVDDESASYAELLRGMQG